MSTHAGIYFYKISFVKFRIWKRKYE